MTEKYISPLVKVDQIQTDDSEDLLELKQKKPGCCSRCLSHKATKAFLKFCFSNIGLCILVVIYIVLGGLLFRAIEMSSPEAKEHRALAARAEKLQKDVAKEIIALLSELKADERMKTKDLADLPQHWNHEPLKKLLNKDSKNFSGKELPNRTSDELFHPLKEQIMIKLKDTLDYYHVELNATFAKGYKGVSHDEWLKRWGISSSILFTASILTVIGYGHVFPISQAGQLAVVLYSVMALPLMSMFLVNVGSWIADQVRFAWHKGICRSLWKRRLINHQEWPTPDKRDEAKIDYLDDDDELDTQTDKDDNNYSLVPASLSVFIVILYISIGTIAYTFWENGWSFINSLYFNWTTMTTIGFGDYVPAALPTPDKGTLSGSLRSLFGSIYIIMGIAIVAMGIDLCIEIIHNKFELMTEKASKLSRGAKKRDAIDLDAAQMYRKPSRFTEDNIVPPAVAD